MSQTIVVREYARLTTAPVAATLDCAPVPASALDWLCELGAALGRGSAPLVAPDGRRTLRLGSYVGVVTMPCGTTLEILPKHTERGDSLQEGRALLQRMIAAALNLPARETSEAQLRLFDAPLPEWVMGRFLAALDRLLKRGARFDYRRVEEEQRFLRGQLNVAAQLRQPPGRRHLFQIRHDVFLPDRPENRLLRSALERVARSTRQPDNWRLAQELRSLLQEVPPSGDVRADFRRWSDDALMAHYRPVRPWCELILGGRSPLAVHGEWQGISLLFPMEKLFERYVEVALRRRLPPGARLLPQRASEYLCQHEGWPMFQLNPDLLLVHEDRRWVLDSKWKLLDAGDRANNYGLSQADFYQLYAYGQRYLDGEGDMALVYPRTERFAAPLGPFAFSDRLRLWALPFELDSGELLGAERLGLPLASAREAPGLVGVASL